MRALSLAVAALMPVSAVATAAPLPAAAVLSTVSGHVLVARNGRLLRARPTMRLVRGDRVVTRADGSARVVMNGCALAMGGSATATIGTCVDTQVSDLAVAGGAGSGGGTAAIAVAGLAAAVAGVVAAAQPGGVPNSP